MNKQVTDYILSASEEQQEVMMQLRQLIHKYIPAAEENIKWGRPVFSTAKDLIYFKSAKAYATLGFFSIQKLEDKNNVLEGTGKDMRHIKIKHAADIDKVLLTKWFKALAK
jgi:hypothetical protein